LGTITLDVQAQARAVERAVFPLGDRSPNLDLRMRKNGLGVEPQFAKNGLIGFGNAQVVGHGEYVTKKSAAVGSPHNHEPGMRPGVHSPSRCHVRLWIRVCGRILRKKTAAVVVETSALFPEKSQSAQNRLANSYQLTNTAATAHEPSTPACL